MAARTSFWTRHTFIALAALLATSALSSAALPSPAQAQSRERRPQRRVQLTLVVESPQIEAETDRDKQQRARRLLAQEAAERILTRLQTIGVKDPRVHVTSTNHIQVTAHGVSSPDVVRGALLAPGHMELRPVLPASPHWSSLPMALPDGIELRQNPGALGPDQVHLWSADFATLHRFTRRLALADILVQVFPDRQGWRTYDLGAPLATESSISSVELRASPSGIPFVQVELQPDAASKATAASNAPGATLALVLDGEIVSLIHRVPSQVLEIPCPDHLRSHQSRQAWAAQVAGRLATPIPVRIAELTEE
ncbi:hypothetical protein DL240_11380 [Lujinxingia litoralis]|uniref:Flagellar assembly protein T N-terminal domain-containing protein n=1 Tax=Lujinxingia litoralis TaxID=2211119 RepID=A0A328C7Q7_9DELT|nr:hypothetical protein [Lujinxingia litoralis]RAL22440.1 hypothetical protein DL240_11380 [Lujinxingia litoralis]